MYKKYFLGVIFFIVTASLIGGILPALISHDSHEMPLIGMAIIVIYLPLAFWFIKKFFFNNKQNRETKDEA